MRYQGIVQSAALCLPIADVEVNACDAALDVLATTRTDSAGAWALADARRIDAFQFRKAGHVAKTVPAASLAECVRLLEDCLIGFQPKLSFNADEAIDVFVHAPSAYRAYLFRHGEARTPILDLGEHAAQSQQVPDRYFVAEGLDWQPSFTYMAPADARPGLYSLLLQAPGQSPFAIPMVLSTPAPEQGRRANLLVLASTNTWESYNFWGGRNLYRNHENPSPPSAQKPIFVPSWRYYAKEKLKSYLPRWSMRQLRRLLRKPTVPRGLDWQYELLSLHRPFTHQGLEAEQPDLPFTNHLAAGEWRLLAWLEREGIDYDIVTDRELHQRPELLRHYQAVVLNTHSEYWSRAMFEGLRQFHEERQGWILNLSGNSIYREVVCTDDGLRCVGVNFAESCADETQLLGVRFSMTDYGTCSPYRIIRPDHWAFADAGIPFHGKFGSVSLNQNTGSPAPTYDPSRPGESGELSGAGASGWETDKLSATAPHDMIVLAKGMNRFGGADLVLREPRGRRGGMLSASSILFTGCLLIDNVASRLVQNVLARALQTRLPFPLRKAA